MSWMVNVYWGTPVPVPGEASTNVGALIGNTTNLPNVGGVVSNPIFITSDTELVSTYGLSTTDELVVAAEDFFAAGGPALWCYAISGLGESITDSNLIGVMDGSNQSFYTNYSPLSTLTGVEVNIGGSGWYAQPSTGYTVDSENGIPLGSITFSGGADHGVVYSGAADGYVTGLFLSAGDLIRADLTISSLAGAFSALTAPNVQFAGFAFAYDQGKVQPSAPAAEGHKYKNTYCYGGKSWLDDVMKGNIMAKQFNNVGKRTIFCWSYPDSIRPASEIGAAYLTGTSREDTGTAYDEIPGLLGANKFSCPSAGKQTTDGTDGGALELGSLMSDFPRKTLTFYPIQAYSQIEYPKLDEIIAWKGIDANPIVADYFTDGTPAIMYGGNNTLGVGVEGDINYIRCKNILTNKLLDTLKVLLYQRNLHYDARGVMRVKNAILGAMQWATDFGYIDGVDSVEIPILPYLYIKSPSDAQQLIIDQAVASKTVGNITARYIWNGDVEEITIIALIGG